MQKVYAITTGEYSDWRIVRVFATESMANQYCNALNGICEYSDTYSIESWIVEDQLPKNISLLEEKLSAGLKRYWINFDRDGNIKDRIFIHDPYDGMEDSEFSNKAEEIKLPPEVDASRYPHITTRVWAKDEKHAIKVASDLRRQLLASQ